MLRMVCFIRLGELEIDNVIQGWWESDFEQKATRAEALPFYLSQQYRYVGFAPATDGPQLYNYWSYWDALRCFTKKNIDISRMRLWKSAMRGNKCRRFLSRSELESWRDEKTMSMFPDVTLNRGICPPTLARHCHPEGAAGNVVYVSVTLLRVDRSGNPLLASGPENACDQAPIVEGVRWTKCMERVDIGGVATSSCYTKKQVKISSITKNKHLWLSNGHDKVREDDG